MIVSRDGSHADALLLFCGSSSPRLDADSAGRANAACACADDLSSRPKSLRPYRNFNILISPCLQKRAISATSAKTTTGLLEQYNGSTIHHNRIELESVSEAIGTIIIRLGVG
ncbi:hypothetical protein BHE74_00040951 [Ensete ventricosum]|nr:hypothetical protein BHE74_00040951 [Ensete ventricosum]